MWGELGEGIGNSIFYFILFLIGNKKTVLV